MPDTIQKLHGQNFPGKEHASFSISIHQKLHTEWVLPMATKRWKKFHVEKSPNHTSYIPY